MVHTQPLLSPEPYSNLIKDLAFHFVWFARNLKVVPVEFRGRLTRNANEYPERNWNPNLALHFTKKPPHLTISVFAEWTMDCCSSIQPISYLYLHPAMPRVTERTIGQVWSLKIISSGFELMNQEWNSHGQSFCATLAVVVRLWKPNIDSGSFLCLHFKGSINWIISLSELPQLDCVPSIFAFGCDFHFCP